MQRRTRTMRAEKPRIQAQVGWPPKSLTLIVGRNTENNLLTLDICSEGEWAQVLIPGLEADELIDALRKERQLLAIDTI